MNLRLAPDGETPAKTRDELKAWGDERLGDARRAAIDAVAESMHSEFLERGKTVKRADVVRWRDRARSAIAAWREVDDIVSEVLAEIDRTEAAARQP